MKRYLQLVAVGIMTGVLGILGPSIPLELLALICGIVALSIFAGAIIMDIRDVRRGIPIGNERPGEVRQAIR